MTTAQRIKALGVGEAQRSTGVDRRSLQRIANGQREPHPHVVARIDAAYRQMIQGIGGRLG